MATKSKTASATSSNFGVKGWIIMILTFFSILLMSNICYDSLNVTIPVFGSTFAQLMGAPESTGATIGMLYMFSTVAAWVSVIGAGLWGALVRQADLPQDLAASLIVGAIAAWCGARPRTPWSTSSAWHCPTWAAGFCLHRQP